MNSFSFILIMQVMNESNTNLNSILGNINLMELSKYLQKMKFSSFNSQNKYFALKIGYPLLFFLNNK